MYPNRTSNYGSKGFRFESNEVSLSVWKVDPNLFRENWQANPHAIVIAQKTISNRFCLKEMQLVVEEA
jgi:hypothetical protein